MIFKTIQNTSLTIDYPTLLNDRGWVLEGITATHYPCMSNTKLKVIARTLDPNSNYTINVNIREIRGSLSVGLDSPVETKTTTGLLSFNVNTGSTSEYITLWGTGYIVIDRISFTKNNSEEEEKPEHSITWSESKNGWVTFKSYRPELGFSMFSDLFTYKDGQLSIHSPEANTYNVFYGKNHDTYIDFPLSSASVKTYNSIAIHANRVIGTTKDGVKTSLGQVSDLMEVDFEEREGIYYANFLRDKLTDIISGDELKGRYIVLELHGKGSKKLQLFKVVVKSEISTPNE